MKQKAWWNNLKRHPANFFLLRTHFTPQKMIRGLKILNLAVYIVWIVEAKWCGQSNCSKKCCLGSNYYSLCRASCDGLLCTSTENCDGGFCCRGQCVSHSLECNEIATPSTSTLKEDNGIVMWKFILIVLGGVIAGVLLCIVVVRGCRALCSYL